MAVKPTPAKAGAYAQQRYRQGLRNYHAKTRWIFRAVFGPFILAGLVVLILDGHELTWIAGAITGAFTGAWLVMRDEPPAYIEHWREGAEGERKTAKALKPLQRSGLRVVHDVKARYGNYDHVAVGRAGVFLLETKNLKGTVELRNGVPHLRRRLDPDADTRLDQIRPRALSAAARLNNDIEHRTGHSIWVQAVVVFWSDFPEGFVDDSRCVFVHGPQLRAWLEDLPDRLDQIEAIEIASAITHIANGEPSENDADVARAAPVASAD
jgi:hypothetical protein